MIVGTVTETYPDEWRVALVPAAVAPLAKAGLEVVVQSGAGAAAGYADSLYADKGAKIAADRAEVFRCADVLLQVRGYGANPEAGRADLELLRQGQLLLAMFEPLTALDEVKQVADRGVTLMAMELIPRITRAQSMDVLSSMATIAGYKAVLLAAQHLPRMFPMMMTAAGTITAARVFIVGVGVAGLQAIATSRRLGAIVEAYDLRPAVKEQVLSLGARFVEMELDAAASEDAGGYAKAMDETFYRRQRELMLRVVAAQDVVITTAAVPGKQAPRLITTEMVEAMRHGSIIVDLAAERGGNCELTRAGQTVQHNGVTILGPLNLAASVPFHASQMYSKNITTLLLTLFKQGQLALNFEDEVVRETVVCHAGRLRNEKIREALGLASAVS